MCSVIEKGGLSMNPKLKDDPLMVDLRKKHPKSGPDPLQGESLDIWAERYMKYVREKYGLEDKGTDANKTSS